MTEERTLADHEEAMRLVNRASRRVVMGQRPSYNQRAALAALVFEDGLSNHDWLCDEELALDHVLAESKIRTLAEDQRQTCLTEQVFCGPCYYLYHWYYYPTIDCSMVGKRQAKDWSRGEDWVPPTLDETIKCVDAAMDRAKKMAKESGYSVLMYAHPENLYKAAQRRSWKLGDVWRPVDEGPNADIPLPDTTTSLSDENQAILDGLQSDKRGPLRVVLYRDPWDADSVSQTVWPSFLNDMEYWKLE